MIGIPSDGAPPPFLILTPPGPPGPVVISVPHAGRYYPPDLDQDRAVAWRILHDLEDRYADRLVGLAVARGAVGIVATHARAWIDLNRADDDRETNPQSPHARAGLGLVPQRLAGRPLWVRPPSAAAIDARVAAFHRPYHAALSESLSAARNRHGFAVLIDCHSMPPLSGIQAPRLVIGDRHGTSAAPDLVDRLMRIGESNGLSTARNRPYAGAHILNRHGQPDRDIHAIQLEFDRSLYLGAGWREPGEGLPRMTALFAMLCAAAAEGPLAESQSIAAE